MPDTAATSPARRALLRRLKLRLYRAAVQRERQRADSAEAALLAVVDVQERARLVPAVMTLREAARYLNCSPKTLRRYVSDDRLRAERMGTGPKARYRFRRSDLDTFLTSAAEMDREDAALIRRIAASD